MNTSKWLKDTICSEVDKWYTAQCKNTFADFYCWYKPGSIVISEDIPGEGYSIAPITGKRGGNAISPAWSIDQAFDNLYKSLYKLPCLPLDIR